MNNFEETPLVGPRPEDNENREVEETNDNGEPLWMALLENDLSPSPDEVHDAKNAFAQLKNEHPEVVSMCAHKKIDECKTIIQSMGEVSEAA